MGNREEREYQYYCNLMNALELIHTENVVVMSTICKLFFTKKTGEELAEKTAREWDNAFKQIRNNW